MASRCAHGSSNSFYLGVRNKEKKLTVIEILVDLEKDCRNLWS
tara:strand:+ start:387 stop:515 length:129 start_codon:yes stop_codon:yes gene_type:complete